MWRLEVNIESLHLSLLNLCGFFCLFFESRFLNELEFTGLPNIAAPGE